MKKKSKAQRSRQPTGKQPITAIQLIRAYRPALLVYAVIRELAKGRRQYSCTRRTIASHVRMDPKTITRAMKMLDGAGWIRLGYGARPDQCRKWYRITFVSDDFIPSHGASTKGMSSQAKKEHTEARPEAHQTVPREKASKGHSLTSKSAIPENHETVFRDEAMCPLNGSKGAADDTDSSSPENHETVLREKSMDPSNGSKGSESSSRTASPWTHEMDPREEVDHPPDGSKGIHPSKYISPEGHQTVPSDGSLDPSNGSKGSVPLEPPNGPYSLERVGGAPLPAPPSTSLALGSGGTWSTPQRDFHGSVPEFDTDDSSISGTAEFPIASPEGTTDPPRFRRRVSPETAAGIQAVIDMIGTAPDEEDDKPTNFPDTHEVDMGDPANLDGPLASSDTPREDD